MGVVVAGLAGKRKVPLGRAHGLYRYFLAWGIPRFRGRDRLGKPSGWIGVLHNCVLAEPAFSRENRCQMTADLFGLPLRRCWRIRSDALRR